MEPIELDRLLYELKSDGTAAIVGHKLSHAESIVFPGSVTE
jgi:hypothetical protein